MYFEKWLKDQYKNIKEYFNLEGEMADIAMCDKKDCPSFMICYRAQAVKNEHSQAYFDFDNNDELYCDDYIPTNPALRNKYEQ